jgi:hypothetical protein
MEAREATAQDYQEFHSKMTLFSKWKELFSSMSVRDCQGAKVL